MCANVCKSAMEPIITITLYKSNFQKLIFEVHFQEKKLFETNLRPPVLFLNSLGKFSYIPDFSSFGNMWNIHTIEEHLHHLYPCMCGIIWKLRLVATRAYILIFTCFEDATDRPTVHRLSRFSQKFQRLVSRCRWHRNISRPYMPH